MKPGIQTLLTLLLAVAVLAGCATAGGGMTLKQIRNDVDFGMVRYHNRVAFGFLSTGEKERVEAAYKAYQSAFNEAFKQANANLQTPAPANVEQLADNVLDVLQSIP